MRWDYYNKKYESMDGWGHPLTFENDEIQKWVFFSFSHEFQNKKRVKYYEPLSEVPVTPECYTCVTPVPLACVPVVKCALLLSVHCLGGFQHCGDHLKQSSPISAGKAQYHVALSETRLAAAQIQPCKSLTAERWSWYRNLLKERNWRLISQSNTSREQGRHKGISGREKETWQPCVSSLAFTDTAAGPGKSYLLCFMFSIWMKICGNCCFMLKYLWRTSWRKWQLYNLFWF